MAIPTRGPPTQIKYRLTYQQSYQSDGKNANFNCDRVWVGVARYYDSNLFARGSRAARTPRGAGPLSTHRFAASTRRLASPRPAQLRGGTQPPIMNKLALLLC